ncbi:signal peptidase II [Listeria monocytogenes]|uniref:Lipoprotein signal peptidase n=4 Tax=Listeria TaxID=1637 RepID=A0A7X0ZDK1_9LIST|nr:MULTISPECIES: signal peptidase II [Listeria]EAF4507457.1 lipoprotein signal peptidase [Listeria monocytogenes serotype 1/2a]EAG6271469.1 lipoprotein signal peptidase [Listeria monocytogenes CFSAN003726]EAG6274247.1 lipoprotein signal peptidase [Listeria monocytogenes CFSAN003808]EAG6280950.1 lipoprotein signal peptidase [Listeria monocytogenes CFSAN003809]EAG6359590.1 lipoprotein signal peptidase [Listeria monocytogenes CFSAN003729]EAG6368499.1 lipoprotein signal peptidase [Listeria monocy
MYYYLITLAVVALDQLTKWIVVQNMEIGQKIEVIPGFLYWTSYRNDGAAWSILEGHMWFFYLITVVVIGIIIYIMQKYAKGKRLFSISLAFILGGAIGNFIDRVLHQEVVDFVQTVWGNYYFPIFNVADASLSVGVVLMLVYVFVDDRKTKGIK